MALVGKSAMGGNICDWHFPCQHITGTCDSTGKNPTGRAYGKGSAKHLLEMEFTQIYLTGKLTQCQGFIKIIFHEVPNRSCRVAAEPAFQPKLA